MLSFLPKNFFTIGLTLLTVLFISASYFRFITLQDYHVVYEVDCDPSEKSCFIGCEDDSCESEYFYYVVEKYAHDVVSECGKSVGDCELAKTCQVENVFCEITFCELSTPDNKCSTLHLDATNVSESSL